MTPELLSPEQDGEVGRFGLGLTDVSKTGQGMDKNVADDQFDPARFVDLVAETRPDAIAFNGRTAAKAVARHLAVRGRSKLACGDQGDWPLVGRVYILPSTSAVNTHYTRTEKLTNFKNLAAVTPCR